ncbi:MAG: HAMP domain-containing histidine kinase, partial [Oscillospiraceae bacterium]|nr:HAMP domain-containing histidine kinase [Oscillospiraceae bacterium]
MSHQNKRIILLFLGFVVIVGIVVWLLNSPLNSQNVVSSGGEWDLRGVNFDKTSVRLMGEVEYVPNALLTPEEFAASDRIVLGDVPEDGNGSITSRIRLLVPDGIFLEIAGFADDMGSRIYINGEHLTDVGAPGTTKEENIPDEKFLSFTVSPKDGVIEIVQQSSNYVFRFNTSHIRWTIGTKEAIDRYTTGFAFSYDLSIGVYLALFLVHLLLFMIMPTYRANIWYALLCLVWVIRNGITSIKPLTAIFPQISWDLAFRVEYLTVLSALVLIVLAYNLIFPKRLPKALRVGTYVSMGAFAAFYLFADTLLMSRTMIIYEIIAAGMAAWALFLLFRRARSMDFKQKIIIISLLLVLISLILDSLFYNNVAPTFIHNVTMQTMLIVFSVFQMTAMFIGTMEEVAAAKEHEQKLALENDALDRVNRMKNDMMATISHEMRTPLAVLSGYSELISKELRQKGADEQTTSDLDKISVETQRLAGIMEEMQNISRAQKEPSRMATLKLDAVIMQVARMYRHILERNNTRLTLDIENDLPMLGNADEMTQVVFNLLSNASKHTENGEVLISAKRNGGRIIVTITDTGVGIDPELLPHVFERYRHGGNEGSGLGLTIARQILEAHGGEIGIESEPRKGTKV